MKKALISVSDKRGLESFVQGLVANDYILYSTGGTKLAIESFGVPVRSVSELTDYPEILDGRVKTLHPNIHAGLLADRDKQEHLDTLKEHHIELIDLVVVNLYPFKETVKKDNITELDAIENIDIGGPTMLRAAAKNFRSVAAVVHPEDYKEVLSRIESDDLSIGFRRELMVKVFAHTNDYDQAIVNYFSQNEQALRYGENPHQSARLVRTSFAPNQILNAKILHGKALSFNNYRDAEAAFSLAKKFTGPASVAVKHMNPCGVGVGDYISEAFQNCLDADPQSIFGGIVALNEPVTKRAADKINGYKFTTTRSINSI